MPRFLLDTNIIVDLLRRRPDARLLIENLLNQGQPLASCPITITEVYAGMRATEEKATRAFIPCGMSPPPLVSEPDLSRWLSTPRHWIRL
jgi:predicted nucleic acid-binding protein